MGLRSTYRRCRFCKKKIIFSDEAHFDFGGYVNKQNCRIWGTENLHAYIDADAPITEHCLGRILVQRHNWAIFLRKWARRGRYRQWRSLSGHVERIFIHQKWRGGYWHHLASTGRSYVPHSRSYIRCLRPVFEDRIISGRADVVWPPRNCDFTPLDYYLWGAVKDKCYDKPGTIEALKDNIREAISEIQLHTIHNMLINWTDRVGYFMASRGSHLNKITFHY